MVQLVSVQMCVYSLAKMALQKLQLRNKKYVFTLIVGASGLDGLYSFLSIVCVYLYSFNAVIL